MTSRVGNTSPKAGCIADVKQDADRLANENQPARIAFAEKPSVTTRWYAAVKRSYETCFNMESVSRNESRVDLD